MAMGMPVCRPAGILLLQKQLLYAMAVHLPDVQAHLLRPERKCAGCSHFYIGTPSMTSHDDI